MTIEINVANNLHQYDERVRATLWGIVAENLLSMADEFMRNEQMLTPNTLMYLVQCANNVLRDASSVSRHGHFLSGWEIRAWEPDLILSTGRVTLVAVDPDGVGHDISKLAASNSAYQRGADDARRAIVARLQSLCVTCDRNEKRSHGDLVASIVGVIERKEDGGP